MRFLIESAGGVFTGSRYKDLQLQMFGESIDLYEWMVFNDAFVCVGFWGEMRGWSDGTTIVQKTHDASKDHVEIVNHAILCLCSYLMIDCFRISKEEAF